MTGEEPTRAAYEAERRRLGEQIVVASAESTLASARVADLVEQEMAARRRHAAAKGQLTRAMRDGGAERIAAARERERATWAAADEVARQGIEEMESVNGAALEALGGVQDQMSRTWAAGDAWVERDREAGQ